MVLNGPLEETSLLLSVEDDILKFSFTNFNETALFIFDIVSSICFTISFQVKKELKNLKLFKLCNHA